MASAVRFASWNLQLGNVSEAEKSFEQVRQTARENGAALEELRGLHGLSLVATTVGEEARARDLLGEVLRRARTMGLRTMEEAALTGLGEIARNQGHTAEARSYYQQAAALADELGKRISRVQSDFNLHLTHLMDRDFDEAASILSRAEQLAHASGLMMFESYFDLSRLALAAARTDWSSFDELLGAKSPWPSHIGLEIDHPWLLELAADLAQEAHHNTRAAKARELARQLRLTLHPEGH